MHGHCFRYESVSAAFVAPDIDEIAETDIAAHNAVAVAGGTAAFAVQRKPADSQISRFRFRAFAEQLAHPVHDPRIRGGAGGPRTADRTLVDHIAFPDVFMAEDPGACGNHFFFVKFRAELFVFRIIGGLSVSRFFVAGDALPAHEFLESGHKRVGDQA